MKTSAGSGSQPSLRPASAGFAGARKPRLIMTTAVWGDWHLAMHFSINLPTLLAPGNLPALAADCDITYLIFTRAADRDRIVDAPETAVLRQLMTVEVQLLGEDDLANPIAAHHKAWNMATERAVSEGSLVLLMPPDVAWAENCFASVVERLARGERAVFMTYMRAESETFVEALSQRKEPGSLSLAVPPNEMVRLCVRSLHPLMAAYFRDSDHFPIHPEMIMWPVRDEGIAVRILAREMFIFDPSYFAINEASLPAERFASGEASLIADSDALFAVSLAQLGKDVAWHVHPRKADPIDIASWWLTYDSPVNDFIAAHKLRWHFAPVTEARWRAVEFAADLFVRRTAATREAMRVWQAARELDCGSAALILALAIHTGLAARGARGRGPGIVLIPTDRPFAENPGLLDRLLEPGNARALVRLLRAHHVPDPGPVLDERDPLHALLAGGDRAELQSGLRSLEVRLFGEGDLRVDAARVVSGPLRLGGHAIYVVDRLLDDVTLPALPPSG